MLVEPVLRRVAYPLRTGWLKDTLQSLGPNFPENRFPEFAFVQDGGEDVFSLPNGWQGYLLVNGRGKRIDAGPIEVVRDLKETSGTPVVVNGISCMNCHQNGMIDFRDSVREGVAIFGEARKKTLELYPNSTSMADLVEQDRQQFLRALSVVLKPWLFDSQQASQSFGEPIAIATRFYGSDVDLQTAAFELGLESPSKLATVIEHNSRLRRLGLGPLIHRQKIDRQVWQSNDAIISSMQQAAREMNLGTPYVVIRYV